MVRPSRRLRRCWRERVTVDARAHAERLTPNVVAALADAGLTMADLDAVVVGCGPGPFTGLRVGMATAAAYGHAWASRCTGCAAWTRSACAHRGEVLVVTDARRREVYWARYRDGVRTGGPGGQRPGRRRRGSARAVAGSPEHAALFGLPLPRAGVPDSGRSGCARCRDWSATPAPLVPLYLRRPDAKPLAARQ